MSLGTNPGLAALWDDERQRQRHRGLDPQITPPDSPGLYHTLYRNRVISTEEQSMLHFKMFRIKSLTLESIMVVNSSWFCPIRSWECSMDRSRSTSARTSTRIDCQSSTLHVSIDIISLRLRPGHFVRMYSSWNKLTAFYSWKKLP